MKRKQPVLTLLGIVITLVLGLTAAGCGPNQADPSASADATSDEEARSVQEATPDEAKLRTRELAVREREIAAREAEMEQRMRELETRSAAVEPRPAQPEPAPVVRNAPSAPLVDPARNEARTVLVTLDAGTPLAVELEQSLSSETNLIGDPVGAVIVRDIVRGTRVIVPAGSKVRGSVTDVVAQRKIGGQARLAVDFDTLVTPAGQQVPIRALLESEGRSQKKKDAATIGGSAAGGALLGRVLSDDDKGKGTVLGAVVGAAVGTAVASRNKADPVILEPGTTAELFLAGPIEVAVLERTELAPVARN